MREHVSLAVTVYGAGVSDTKWLLDELQGWLADAV